MSNKNYLINYNFVKCLWRNDMILKKKKNPVAEGPEIILEAENSQ